MTGIRELTGEEKIAYTTAIVTAVDILPAFRDGLALLRPYYNDGSPFAMIDAHSRVGLGPLFFKASTKQKASVLLHEIMHVFNNHFSRGESTGINDPILLNEAGDFEINVALDKIPRLDISFGIFPDSPEYGYPRNLTMEQYSHKLWKDRGKNQEEPESGNGPSDDSNPNDDSNSDPDSNNDNDKNSKNQETSDNDKNDESDGGKNEDSDDASDGDNTSDSDDSSDSDGDDSDDTSSSGGTSGSESEGGNDSDKEGNSSSSGSSSNAGSLSKEEFAKLSEDSCNIATEADSEAADKAGIERASDLEQNIAKKNTKSRLEEERRKSLKAGTGSLTSFIDFVLDQLTPSRVPWARLFSSILSRTSSNIIQGKADYSYRRVNRRMIASSKYIFPGLVAYQPKALIGVDTSGSMQDEDFLYTLSEVDTLARGVFRGDALELFTVDTKIASIQPVKNVKELDLIGGGGTDMTAAWEYVLNLPNHKKPDIFILATDGGFSNWNEIVALAKKAQLQSRIKSIILITEPNGFERIPENIKREVTILDISIDPRKSSWES